MRHILLATDLSDRSDRAFARAATLTEQSGAKLHLLCVIDDGLPSSFARAAIREAEAGLREAVAGVQSRGVAASYAVELGRPHEMILKAASDAPCDLVVLGTHRYDAFSDLFLGTTVERVIRYGRSPVLMVRERPKGAYKSIVVAVDFSPSSERALAFALKLAQQATFRVVHTFETPFPGFLPRENYAAEIRQERKILLQQLVERCASELAGSRPSAIETIVVDGSVDAAVREVIQEDKTDLLVVGTHGRTGISHAFIGSVAERFLSRPPCDVLAVRS